MSSNGSDVHPLTANEQVGVPVTRQFLGLGGFVVLAAARVGGDLEVLVETEPAVIGPVGCGVLARAHGRAPRAPGG
ncbi:MAG: hypothetical protein ACXV3F_08525 [Frankiaceae bacterium]